MKLRPEERLIVALDVETVEKAARLVKRLTPLGVAHFKVGLSLFTQAGPAAVEAVHEQGGKVFLDLKFHDIPNTVANAVRAAAQLKVWMVNVHIQGGGAMMRSALSAAEGNGLLLIGVTVLTSMAEKDLMELGVNNPLERQVLALAKLAASAGLNGVVASAREAAVIRETCGEKFLIVTPGIRTRDKTAHDQQRTAGPLEAIRAGADYLVVGRPILEATDPEAAAAQILEECSRS